jgi:hypothetical protein
VLFELKLRSTYLALEFLWFSIAFRVLDSLRPLLFPLYQSRDVGYFCCVVMARGNYNSIKFLFLIVRVILKVLRGFS